MTLKNRGHLGSRDIEILTKLPVPVLYQHIICPIKKNGA